jgi:O-antigen/teichoic acid export membrane protein
MQLLLPYALTRGLCIHLGTVLNAIGRPDVGFKYSMAVLPFLVGAVFLGSQFGVNGAAMATGLAFGATGPILTLIVFRTVGWPFRRFLESSRSALFVAVSMGVGVWLIRVLLPDFAWRTSEADLAVFGLLGPLLFAGLLYWWDWETFSDLVALLRRSFVRRK